MKAMIRRIAVAVAILASALTGVAVATSSPAGATDYVSSSCVSSYTLDHGWHWASRAGWVFHTVEDNYYTHTANGTCFYVSHVAVDMFPPGGGYYLAVWEAWLDDWARPVAFDYGGIDIMKANYYSANYGTGVQSTSRQTNTNAWRFYFNNNLSYYGGTETERYGLVYSVTNYLDNNTNRGYFARVVL